MCEHCTQSRRDDAARTLQDPTTFARLSANDQRFAASLMASFTSRRGVSDKQAHWLVVLADRATGKVQKPALGEEKVSDDFPKLVALFERAREHLKFPSIVLHDDTVGGIKVHVAGERAKHPGSLTVVTAHSREWLGRVHKDGTFSFKQSTPKTVIDLLRRFAVDPAGEAARYGRLHGVCCFCGRPLKDERSTVVGYGPVCARHFGLAWGADEYEFTEAA